VFSYDTFYYDEWIWAESLKRNKPLSMWITPLDMSTKYQGEPMQIS
jgi:hypothetical protein